MAFLDEGNVELSNPHPVATEQTQATAEYDDEEEEEEHIAPATYAELMNKGPTTSQGKTAAEILAAKLEDKIKWKNEAKGEKAANNQQPEPIIEEGDLPDIAIELLTQGQQ